MIIICTENEKKFLKSKCDGRCLNGSHCVFADGTAYNMCPIANDNVIIAENHPVFGFLNKKD